MEGTTSASNGRAFELLLRFPDGREEPRLTDHLDGFDLGEDLLAIGGQRWRVTETAPPSAQGLGGRLVCDVCTDGEPGEAEPSDGWGLAAT